MANYPTPHINATPSDFAETVLMPGDPMRSKFIAENFLENARLVNNVRGIQGYTGKYKGCSVSVMASGMGMPSIGIYSQELFGVFGVENILRVGSAGALVNGIRMRDIVMGMGACTDSNYAHKYYLAGTFAPICSYRMLRTCTDTADEMGIRYHVGSIVSSDIFYNDDENIPERLQFVPSWSSMGVMAVEMEAAALYMNAARFKKNALAICTISDNLVTDEHLGTEERQSSFTEMIELALNTAVKLS